MIQMSRRNLVLGGALGAAGALGASRPSGAAAKASETTDLFNLDPRLLYFNSANIAPGFRAASAAEAEAALIERTDPSFESRERFIQASATLRSRIAAHINASADGIAITRNCSEGNFIIVRGVPLRPGDEVIIGRENHQSNRLGWERRAAQGVVIKIARHPSQPKSPKEIVDAFAAQVTPRTKVIAISQVSNLAGLIMPVVELGELARAHGVWFHVDAAQSYGWLKIDVAAMRCDSLAASGQKWLMGPIGGGVLFVRPDRLGELDTPLLGHGYWQSGPPTALNGQILEQIGQVDDAKLLNYLATLDARAQIGEAAIEARLRDRAARLRAGFARKGKAVWGTDDAVLWGPIIGVPHAGDVLAFRAARYREHRVALSSNTIDGVNLLRVSPHYSTTDEQIDRLVELLV